jgi:aryl carrier-like protein
MSTISFFSRRAQKSNGPTDAEAPQEGDIAVEDLESVWKTILRVQTVAPEDNLFELGGTSLHAMLLASHVERLDATLNLVGFLEMPTFEGLCTNITRAS